MDKVIFRKSALKQLDKAPQHIQVKMTAWVRSIHTVGLLKTREIPGYHDEPLKGKLQNHRSIRLSRQWRAIYTETTDSITLVTVEAVTAHDYQP